MMLRAMCLRDLLLYAMYKKSRGEGQTQGESNAVFFFRRLSKASNFFGVVRCSLISILSLRFFFCRRRLRMNVAFVLRIKKTSLFRLLFRRQIGENKKKRDLSLVSIFFVCVIY